MKTIRSQRSNTYTGDNGSDSVEHDVNNRTAGLQQQRSYTLSKSASLQASKELLQLHRETKCYELKISSKDVGNNMNSNANNEQHRRHVLTLTLLSNSTLAELCQLIAGSFGKKAQDIQAIQQRVTSTEANTVPVTVTNDSQLRAMLESSTPVGIDNNNTSTTLPPAIHLEVTWKNEKEEDSRVSTSDSGLSPVEDQEDVINELDVPSSDEEVEDEENVGIGDTDIHNIAELDNLKKILEWEEQQGHKYTRKRKLAEHNAKEAKQTIHSFFNKITKYKQELESKKKDMENELTMLEKQLDAGRYFCDVKVV
jgi:hypothetical protein